MFPLFVCVWQIVYFAFQTEKNLFSFFIKLKLFNANSLNMTVNVICNQNDLVFVSPFRYFFFLSNLIGTLRMLWCICIFYFFFPNFSLTNLDVYEFIHTRYIYELDFDQYLIWIWCVCVCGCHWIIENNYQSEWVVIRADNCTPHVRARCMCGSHTLI